MHSFSRSRGGGVDQVSFRSQHSPEQGRQCTYNVTSIRATIFVVEKQYLLYSMSFFFTLMTRYLLWVCVCSLYPASNVHALYCLLWPARFHNIFPYYLTHDNIYDEKKNVIEHKMCVFIFSTTFVRNISHYEKNWARYDQKF